MGDTSKDSTVEKLCESMQKMFAQLMEQAQVRTSSTTELQKITIESNPVKLTGPGDYFSWSRNALLILESHGLHKYLSENEKKADNVTQEQWEQNQKRVMVWLLSSMEKTVREQVENFQTAAEVWTSIEKQFSGKSNKMQVSRILHEMRHIRQDQKTVTEYAGELKKLYRDLEFFRPFKPHDTRDLALLREWFESILVQTFLEGLNEEFRLRSQLIFALPNWPTLDDAVASILEEETRLSNQPTTHQLNADTRAALSSSTQLQSTGTSMREQASAAKTDYKKKTRIICDHCDKPGHIKRNCFEIIGYPPGWQQRQQNRSRGGGSNLERRQKQVHFTSTANEKALEEYKSMLASVSNDEPVEYNANFHATRGTEVREDSWDWHRA